MSTVASSQAPSSGVSRVETPAADHRDGRRHRLRPGRLIALALVVAAVAAGMPSAIRWVDDRRSHSITDDAFVEAHIVNIAPQLVSGRIVRLLAEEDDRVVQGQVMAEIDSISYRDKVNVARAQLDSALAELDRQRRPGPHPQGGPDPGRDRPADLRLRRGRPGQGRGVAQADRGRCREGDRRGPRRAEGRPCRSDPRPGGSRPDLEPGGPGLGDPARARPDGARATPRGPTSSWPRPGWPRPSPRGRRSRSPAARWRPPRSPSRRQQRGSNWRRSASTRFARSSCWSRSSSGPPTRPGGP